MQQGCVRPRFRLHVHLCNPYTRASMCYVCTLSIILRRNRSFLAGFLTLSRLGASMAAVKNSCNISTTCLSRLVRWPGSTTSLVHMQNHVILDAPGLLSFRKQRCFFVRSGMCGLTDYMPTIVPSRRPRHAILQSQFQCLQCESLCHWPTNFPPLSRKYCNWPLAKG